MSLIKQLRTLYREGKMDEFNRVYGMGKWMLTEEERNKIEVNVFNKTSPLVDYAVKELGWKKINGKSSR